MKTGKKISGEDLDRVWKLLKGKIVFEQKVEETTIVEEVQDYQEEERIP